MTYSASFHELIESKKRTGALIAGCGMGTGNVDIQTWENRRQFIHSAIDKSGTILDIGCGNGFLLRCLQEWSGVDLVPYGIDIHPLQDGEAETCENILRALPSWFGIEEAIVEYCGDIKKMETYVAKIDDQVVGFLTLNTHNEFTAEIQVIAVKEDTHRQGVGKQLTHHIENILQTRTMEYLTVKTLGPSKASKEYDLTRQFYMAMGFRPLEENDLWGKDNPCLIMVKSITRQ